MYHETKIQGGWGRRVCGNEIKGRYKKTNMHENQSNFNQETIQRKIDTETSKVELSFLLRFFVFFGGL